MRDAVRHLEQAVTLDPGFALAHGTLAEVYINLGNISAEPREKVYPLAKASAERALALDERNVHAHTALGEYAFHYAWDWEASDRHLRRALAVDPNFLHAVLHTGSHDFARNRVDSALAAARKARELNPLLGSSGVINVLIRMKRYDEVIGLAQREIAERPTYKILNFYIGLAQFLDGRHEEGLRTLEDFAKTALAPEIHAGLGWCYGMAGQKEKARAVLAKLEARDKTREVTPSTLAIVYVGLGESDRAFELLERAYEQREPLMSFMGSSFYFDPIRADPRFRSLLKRMKLDAYFPESAAR